MTFGRSISRSRCAAILTLAALLVPAIVATAAERPDIAAQLRSGEFAAAEQVLTAHLDQQANDDLARFQLGTVQLLRAVQQLVNDVGRYGPLSRAIDLPFVRMGTFAERQDEPAPVTYDDLRAMIARFQSAVERAEATLEPIRDERLSWKLDLREVRFDLDGDGQAAEQVTLGVLLGLRPMPTMPATPPGDLTVNFDSADVYWLRGYCHVVMALADMVLAYDHEPLFEHTAHLFFAKPKTEFVARRNAVRQNDQPNAMFGEDIFDVIAAIHLMKFKLREPDRMAAAQQHLLAMVALSRRSWELVQAETDNDREWIPGPHQQSVNVQLIMDRPRVDAWHTFLEEAESLLQGQKLAPFWRDGFEGGVNIGRAFTEPRDFDLVLWIQGSTALPYLETGEQTTAETWRMFQQAFGGDFFWFALWIN